LKTLLHVLRYVRYAYVTYFNSLVSLRYVYCYYVTYVALRMFLRYGGWKPALRHAVAGRLATVNFTRAGTVLERCTDRRASSNDSHYTREGSQSVAEQWSLGEVGGTCYQWLWLVT